MSRGRASIVIVLAGCGLMGGCCRPAESFPPRPVPNTHLIYNAEATLPVTESLRSAWPEAVASEWAAEFTSYREVIHDYQGRFGRAEDQYLRRFDSYRVGQFRR